MNNFQYYNPVRIVFASRSPGVENADVGQCFTNVVPCKMWIITNGAIADDMGCALGSTELEC